MQTASHGDGVSYRLRTLAKRLFLSLYFLRWKTFDRATVHKFHLTQRYLSKISRQHKAGLIHNDAFEGALFSHIGDVVDATADLISDELEERVAIAVKLLWKGDFKRPAIHALIRDHVSAADRSVAQLIDFYPYDANSAFRTLIEENLSYYCEDNLIALFKEGKYRNVNRVWHSLYDRTAVSAIPPIPGGEAAILGFICADSVGGDIRSRFVRYMLEVAADHLYTVLGVVADLSFYPPQNDDRFLLRRTSSITVGWRREGSGLHEVQPSSQRLFESWLETARFEQARQDQIRPTQELAKTVARAVISPRAEGSDYARPLTGSDEMNDLEQVVNDIGSRGAAIYESKRAELEAEHFGSFVIFNVKTGEYLLSHDPEEAWTRYEALYGDDPSFEIQVGGRSQTFGPGRILQPAP